MVFAQKGVLQRSAGTLHLGGGAQEYATAALFGKGRQRLPGGGSGIRAVVDAAYAFLADQGRIHAFDLGVVQAHAGGHDQVVVGDGLASIGDDLVAVGIDLGHAGLHPFHAGRHVFTGGADHVVTRLDAGSDQGKARLVIVLLAGIDHDDPGTVQTLHQAVGRGQACGTTASNDDARLGLDPAPGLRHRRCQTGSRRGGSTQHQRTTAADLHLGSSVTAERRLLGIM